METMPESRGAGDVSESIRPYKTQVASLVDWFNLFMPEFLDRREPANGEPILWSADTCVLRQSIVGRQPDPTSGDVSAYDGQVLMQTDTRVYLDFTYSEIVLEIENQEFFFHRHPHVPGMDEFTQVQGHLGPWNFAGRIRRAWYVDEGRALAFVTNKSEYFTLTSVGLISFGTHRVFGPNSSLAKPSFVSSQRRLFMVLDHGEVLELREDAELSSHILPNFPPNLWEEMDSNLRSMTPQDIREDDYNFHFVRIPEPSLDRDLGQMVRALKPTSTAGRVLVNLIENGAKSIRDIFEGDPDKLFPGANKRLKSKKVASGLVAAEIRRVLKVDDSRCEQSLLLSEFYGRGWPVAESSDFAARDMSQEALSGEIQLSNYVSMLRDRWLPVQEVRASRMSDTSLEFVLPAQMVVTVDSSMEAVAVSVPFWNADRGARGVTETPSLPLKYGSNTIEFLTVYAQALISGLDQGSLSSSVRQVVNVGTQGLPSYRRFGKVDYVSLLKLEANQLIDLPDETLRNLEILRSRSEGMTLEQVGKKFGLTREAVRQKISKHGGEDFKLYLGKLKVHRQNTENGFNLTVRDYIQEHPGITMAELVMCFDKPQALIQKCLTKHERKLISGVRPSRDRTQLWSDEAILESLQLAQTYHYPLTTSGYQELIDVGEIRGPSVPLITTRFKTWKLACIAAGVEYLESVKTYSLTWSREDLIAVICQYLQDPTTSGSVTDYDAWREASTDRLPSRAQLRIVVGRWSEACDEALGTIRANSWDA